MMSKKSFLVAILSIVVCTQIIDVASEIGVRNDIKGQFLTPEEGCGISSVPGSSPGPAKNGAWPWLALVGHKNGATISFSCGGSLITSRHVLTGARCAQRQAKINFVRLGEYDLSTESDGKHVDIPIKDVEVHTSFIPLLQVKDIAIIQLDRDVDFTDRIRPVCLPTGDHWKNLNMTGSSAVAAGWGHLDGNTKTNNVLHEIQMSVIHTGVCKVKHQNARKYNDNDDIRFNKMMVICAAFPQGTKDACHGDTGGALMLPEKGRIYQIGITSYGLGCNQPNIPIVHTYVSNYIDWILRNLK